MQTCLYVLYLPLDNILTTCYNAPTVTKSQEANTMFTCDGCKKEHDENPYVCFCGGEFCWPCYAPHIQTHAVVETPDEPEDAYIDDCIEMVIS